MQRLVVISGCSGAGKSTLLAALRARGHAVVEEPGRRIVAQQTQSRGRALPWIDMPAFLRRAMALAEADLARMAGHEGWVFFDRGLIDAAAGLEREAGIPLSRSLGTRRPYRRMVFLAPPWPEIYRHDPERRHGFDAAVAEHRHLARVYPALGYDVAPLPRADVQARADFVLEQLNESTR